MPECLKSIISLSNADVDEVKRLRRRQYRRRTGLVIVEGYPEVQRAIKAGIDVRTLYVCPEIKAPDGYVLDQDDAIPISRDDFDRIAFGERLKGILAICEAPKLQLSDLQLSSNPFIVILENVEKPGNIGTIIRSCDGAGVDAVIVCNNKTDLYSHHVVRSSMGTVFHVPSLEARQEETMSFLREHKVNLLAATSKADHNYDDLDFRKPIALVVGSEHDGLSPFWFNEADQTIKIPMQGESDCLNAAMSASILVYEVLRQRRK